MADSRHISDSTIKLREAHDGDRPVLVHPANNDIFVMTGQQAIRACQLGISIQVWVEEFTSMTDFARRWCQERADRVLACYVAPRSNRVVLHVIPASDAFDFDLAEQLVELQTQIAQQFRIGHCEVGQIPRTEMDRFINLDAAQKIHG